MKRIFTTLCIIYTIGYAINTLAQKALKGDVPNNAHIVTNEVDTLQTVIDRGGAVTNAPWLLHSAWLTWINTNNVLKTSDTNDWTVSAHDAWITAEQVPAYDNTKIISVDSNHFIFITSSTNLALYATGTGTYTLTYEPWTVFCPVVLAQPPWPSPFSFAKTGTVTVVKLDGWTITAGAYSDTTRLEGPYGGLWCDSIEPTGYPISLYPFQGEPTSYGTPLIEYSPNGTNAVATFASQADVAAAMAEKELHTDSYTNIIWRSVYSNGWMWLVAFTNYPAN